MVHLRELHSAYSDRAQFLFVAVSEAGHELPPAIRRSVEPAGTAGPHETRRRILRAGMQHYGLPFPFLVDSEDKEVERLYSAYPERLVLVDEGGRVAWDSRIVPYVSLDWDVLKSKLAEQARPAAPDL